MQLELTKMHCFHLYVSKSIENKTYFVSKMKNYHKNARFLAEKNAYRGLYLALFVLVNSYISKVKIR